MVMTMKDMEKMNVSIASKLARNSHQLPAAKPLCRASTALRLKNVLSVQ